MISAWTKTNDRARARVMAVRNEMEAADISPDELFLTETDYGIEKGAIAFDNMMKCPKPPTVIICGNDVLATGALKQAKTINLNVPNDISITGFDDIELAKIVTPKLTTVHVPHRKMGATAARSIVKLVNGSHISTTTELEVSLKIRASLKEPRKEFID
jgi:LacI family transcriptional regulator